MITRAQCLSCGLTRDQIDGRVATGHLLAVARGLYRLAGAPVTWRSNARGACLAGPAGTVASHLTAAGLFSLCPPPVLPHVTIPPGRSPRMRLAVVHRSAVPRVDRVTVDGIPATSPARALCDCATLLGFDALAAIADRVLARRLTRPEAVLEALSRAARNRGRRGEALLREVLEAWSGGIRHDSVPEARLLRRLRSWGYPEPACQFEIYDGGRLLAVFDFAWPDLLVGLEYDGEEAHNPRTWAKEERRDARLEDLGWWIGRVGKADLRPGVTHLRETLDIVFATRMAA